MGRALKDLGTSGAHEDSGGQQRWRAELERGRRRMQALHPAPHLGLETWLARALISDTKLRHTDFAHD